MTNNIYKYCRECRDVRKIIDYLSEPEFTIFKKFVELFPDILALVTEESYITLFLPTDCAIEKYGVFDSYDLDTLTEDQLEEIKQFVEYHIINCEFFYKDMCQDTKIQTLCYDKENDEYKYIVTNRYEETIPSKKNRSRKLNKIIKLVNGHYIMCNDVILYNGVIHVINKVLVPPEYTLLELINNDVGLSIFNTLVNELISQNSCIYDLLNDNCSNLTIFAPTNDAFYSFFCHTSLTINDILNDCIMLEGIVLNHIVQEGIISDGISCYNAITMNNNPITVYYRNKIHFPCNWRFVVKDCCNNIIRGYNIDQLAKNGVLHTIDRIFFDC